MEKLLISGCLIGNNTKYNGGNNYNPKIELLREKYEFIVICPEAEGGLPIPRDPSEISGDKVISCNGKDVTEEFTLGAKIAFERCKKEGCKKALLKEKSPSCGSRLIYDGTFTGTKVKGEGMTVRLLRSLDIEIYNEDEIDKLL